MKTLGLTGENDGCSEYILLESMQVKGYVLVVPAMFEYLHSKEGGAERVFPLGFQCNMITNAGKL